MANPLVLAPKSQEALPAASVMSYGDADILDYDWYSSLPLPDRALWWEDMESLGKFPDVEIIGMVSEWHEEEPNAVRTFIRADVMLQVLMYALKPVDNR